MEIKTSPKDFFLHLLAIVTLYISAVSFGALIFQFINKFFPDPLVDFYGASFAGPIRWAIASLVIVFPAYVWISWFLAKDTELHPEKRELKIRKWLFYFTLFAAAIVIIGDLVALIYNFLGGDLSVRFVLKILTILFIAASVFGYYLWNLRVEQMASRAPRMKWFVFGVIAAVSVATIYGFFVVGSPFAERLHRFDERRVQDLQNIQWQVVNYWQRKERLPENLDNLRDEISGYAVPRDPESGSAYGYRILGDLKFELCAAFKTKREETLSGAPVPAFPEGRALSENWRHGVGRACFERSIDPELYPPFDNKKVKASPEMGIPRGEMPAKPPQ